MSTIDHFREVTKMVEKQKKHSTTKAFYKPPNVRKQAHRIQIELQRRSDGNPFRLCQYQRRQGACWREK